MGKLDDTVGLDIIDLDMTGSLPDKNEFDGIIEYTDDEIEAAKAAKEVAIDVAQTKVISTEEVEEIIGKAGNGIELDTDVVTEDSMDISDLESKIELELEHELKEEAGEGDSDLDEEGENDEDNDSDFDEEYEIDEDSDYDEDLEDEENDEEFEESEEIDEEEYDDPEDKYLDMDDEEVEALGDLTYHDEDEEPVRRRAPKREEKKPTSVQNSRAEKKTVNKQSERPNTKPSKRTSPREDDEPRGGIAGLISRLTWMDGVIVATAIILITLVSVIVLKMMGVSEGYQVEELTNIEFAGIGSSLAGLESVGNDSIDAFIEKAGENIESIPVEEPEATPTEMPVAIDDISVNFTSIQKDLKIKFTNKTENKLVKGVKFEVEVKDPKGKALTWADDDMDGSIYQKDLMPGEYAVIVKSVGDYHFPETPTKVKVKDKITYVAINVVDEIKKESEINAAVEDLQQTATVDKGDVLKDTVAWVDSSKTTDETFDNGYAEIKKDTITDPEQVTTTTTTAAISKDARFLRTAELEPVPTEAPAEPTAAPTEAPTPEPTPEPTVAPTEAPTPEATATPTPTPEVTATPSPTPTPEATATPTPSPSPTPVGKNLKISATTDKLTLKVGETKTFEVTVTGTEVNTGKNFVSSNDAVASVDGNGLITAKTAGTAEITAKSIEKADDGNELTIKCTVTVVADPRNDNTTLLKDKSGNQVYIKTADGKFMEAHFADYYKDVKFYIQSDAVYKYTGWQTINGATYYYNENGEMVTGEQVIGGIKYNFTSEGKLNMNGGALGIDVSKWQSSVDWNAVKNSGVTFVIIRCGYRGSATGVLVEDPKFRSYVSGASKAGLKVGLYFFTQAINEVEAVEEASMCISLAKGNNISYPIFIDTEKVSNGRANGLDKNTRTAVCKAFCETIKSAGYTPGVYGSKTWFTDNLNMSSLNNYKIWLAQYASTPTYSGKYDMWQYTEKGKISGIKEAVDINISYLGY